MSLSIALDSSLRIYKRMAGISPAVLILLGTPTTAQPTWGGVVIYAEWPYASKEGIKHGRLPSGILEDTADQIENSADQHRRIISSTVRMEEFPQMVRHRSEKSLLLAKSPSNRGRTSDLGIAQYFLYSPTLFQLSYRRARCFEPGTSEVGIAYFQVRGQEKHLENLLWV